MGTFQRAVIGVLILTAGVLRLYGVVPSDIIALASIATGIGIALLAWRMFDSWEITVGSLFFAVFSSWDLMATRNGDLAVLAACAAVWLFFVLYRGIETGHIWYWFFAGAILGLGYQYDLPFRILGVAVIVVLVAYWLALWIKFRNHGRFKFARQQILGSIALMAVTVFIFSLPEVAQLTKQGFDMPWTILASGSFWSDLVRDIPQTLALFFLPESRLISLPFAVLFVAGLIHIVWRFVHSWRMHGHPGVSHSLILGWLFVGLASVSLADTTVTIADSSRLMILFPVVCIYAGIGFHWLRVSFQRWYRARDERLVCLPWYRHAGRIGERLCIGESVLATIIAASAVLLSVGISEISRYF